MDLHLKLGCRLIIYVTILASHPTLSFPLSTDYNKLLIHLFSVFTAFCFSLGELFITHTLLHQSGIHNCCHVLSLSLSVLIYLPNVSVNFFDSFHWIDQFVSQNTPQWNPCCLFMCTFTACVAYLFWYSLFLVPVLVSIISDSFGISFPTSSLQLIHSVCFLLEVWLIT